MIQQPTNANESVEGSGCGHQTKAIILTPSRAGFGRGRPIQIRGSGRRAQSYASNKTGEPIHRVTIAAERLPEAEIRNETVR